MDRCIIIQGPTNHTYVLDNKNCWSGNPLIFSTWSDSDKSAYDLENDIVLFNDYPPSAGVRNWEYQRISTLNGIKKAKELGYKRVLKWRSDFKTNNSEKFLELFDLDKINFYAFMDHMGGYVTDFFMEGDINDMLELFDFEGEGQFPEKILTDRLYQLNLHHKINFICKSLNNDANVYWYKLNYWFTNNINDKNYLDKIVSNI
jgi:hypothetical protein